MKTAHSDMPRVFYIEPVGAHRGMHYYDFELCPALQSAGADITLLTCDEEPGTTVPPNLKVETPFLRIYGSAPRLFRGLAYLRALVRIGWEMRRRRVSLAHFHYLHFLPLDYAYLECLHFMGKKLVLTVHDVIPFDIKPEHLSWLRRIYHGVDCLIVHTAHSRQVMINRFGVSEDKIRVIPFGPFSHFSDRQAVSSHVAKQQLGLDPDTPVVLFFGQIKRVKGLQYLIEAFADVVAHRPDARLVIAGPEWKDSFESYATLVKALGLDGKVLTRIEYVPDNEVGLYFSAADLVALPYTESYQSAVLYMAFSFGKPVVASSVGGLAEVVEDGVTGLLVPPADSQRLAEALLILLGDKETARAIGERGRTLAKTEFDWAEIAKETVQIYRELIAMKGGR